MEKAIKMKTNETNIGSENQEQAKKESVSLFRRKRQTFRLFEFYPLLGAKVATFNE